MFFKIFTRKKKKIQNKSSEKRKPYLQIQGILVLVNFLDNVHVITCTVVGFPLFVQKNAPASAAAVPEL